MATNCDQQPGNLDDALAPEDIAAFDEMDRMFDEHLWQAREAGPGDPSISKKYNLEAISENYLPALRPAIRSLVVEEAQRLQERLSCMPLHAERARRTGGRSWLDLAISYGPTS